VKRAKLEDGHFHDCRHHFASWFMMRGGNLLALSKILGHANVSVTEKYAHLALITSDRKSPGPSASWNQLLEPTAQHPTTMRRKW